MFTKKIEAKAMDKNPEMREKLTIVFNAMKEKGYDPITQIMDYLLTEDLVYATSYNNARNIISEMDRDEIFRCILENYFNL